MACFVQFTVRHNLSKAFRITNKLTGTTLFQKQHARHLPRWAHRRPLKVTFAENSNKDEVNYAMKLKIERENIQSLTENQEHLFENGDITSRDKGTVINTNMSKSQNTLSKSVTNLNGMQHIMPDWNDESDKLDATKTEATQKSSSQSKSKKQRKLEKKLEMKALKIKESATKAGVPMYTKLEDNDTKLSNLMLISKSKNKKKKRSHIVLEGKRLIKDATEAGYVPEMVFFSRVKDAAYLKLPEDGVQLYKLPYKSISLWSDLTTSPGILGILKTPAVHMKKPGKDALPLTIICDNIRDPGNLGTILRGAAGVGCQKVILTKGCVDLWDPKVLRSGAGAHFRTAVITDVEWDELERHVDSEASVFLADSNAHILEDIQENEEDNVSSDDESQHEYKGEGENMMKNNPEISESLELYRNRLSSIPVVPYFSIDYANQSSIILVIGGETEGLSIDALKLACDSSGIRLNVPLSNDIESLNSGTALGIIAFEMKRQFLTKLKYKFGDSIVENAEKINIPNM